MERLDSRFLSLPIDSRVKWQVAGGSLAKIMNLKPAMDEEFELEDLELVLWRRVPGNLLHVTPGIGSHLGLLDLVVESLKDLLANPASRSRGVFSLTFDSPDEAVPGDVDLWEELGLPLATGEAFPEMHFYSKDGARRPTSRELVFTTTILNALAGTSEDDLDSGRWEKMVEVAGNPVRCVMSIPNLTETADVASGTGRGQIPYPFVHEQFLNAVQAFVHQHADEMSIEELNSAINARFAGIVSDEVTNLEESPYGQASALCCAASESRGRRRIQLARQALAIDPEHVNALVLLAESTRQPEERIRIFERAIECGAKELGEEREELTGHYWGILETRPFMRAKQGYAAVLAGSGRPREAIGQYLEMLRLNPSDNQGVRYEVVPLMIACGLDQEAREILARYDESGTQWLHLQALVEFRESGPSASAKEAIRDAFRANVFVVERLQSDDPPLPVEYYSWGSPEEAELCIDQLLDAWSETAGYLDWMVREYDLWHREKSSRQRKSASGRNAQHGNRKPRR
jgi:tetratricopeptide (TPR) repeat protein